MQKRREVRRYEMRELKRISRIVSNMHVPIIPLKRSSFYNFNSFFYFLYSFALKRCVQLCQMQPAHTNTHAHVCRLKNMFFKPFSPLIVCCLCTMSIHFTFVYQLLCIYSFAKSEINVGHLKLCIVTVSLSSFLL